MRIARASVAGLAGAVGAGVLAWPVAAAADNDKVYLKRQETEVELVAFDDEDGDDTADKVLARDTVSRDTRSKASRVSRLTRSRGVSRDKTNSRKTAVSRDRDRSRGDRTRDWTRDGGQKKRDWSANRTNDRSRNDTRPRPRA